jgi:serine/threonine protein kinase
MRINVDELFHAVANLSPEARRRYFTEQNIDTSACREVEELLAFDSPSNDALELHIRQVADRVLASLEPKALQCGPYLLGDLLGRGGMGAVHLAERIDGEIKQRVAVKLLRPGADYPALRQRFLTERQILATLSHPNIARLLDAGHREDGQPYLVMEFVSGQTIDAYSADFGIRQKIDLFLKVCAAVSYLHRNLIVHRDLKPANILVTEEGEPKLLDFGIAKLLDLTMDVNATSTRILTPDYASPEQVTGGPITTATDIYSLGAVLYKLLTGASPHNFQTDSAGAIASEISNGRIAPPSELWAGLKGDLEVILMKALRTEPQERYTSVDAFADDLHRYLDRRPVEARSSDLWYRTRKLLRHYWAPAAATAVVIASLSAGLYLANRQRLIAEHRFAQLRQLSNRIIDLDRAIRTLPGSVEARRRLVSASLEYLEGLSPDARNDVDLAQEISDGYWRMARIQGVNAEFNLGDSAKAEDSLRKADTLIESVLASRPLDRSALLRSAVIAHDRMIVADTEDRRADILLHTRKTVDRLEAFLRLNAPQSERKEAASLYANIALTYVNVHMYEDGARYARRGVELAQSIPSAQDVGSKCLSILANALRYQGDLDAALGAIRKARELSERAAYPSQTARMFGLYGIMLREGRILGEAHAVNLGRPAEAVAILEKALKMIEEAAREDVNDSASRARVATTARELGDILREENPRRALEIYDLGIHRLEEMHNSLKARRDRAQLLANSSYPLRRLHRIPESKARIAEALAILKDTKDYPADQIRLGSYAYMAVCALADHAAETGDLRRAMTIYQELLGKILASRPRPETLLTDAVSMSRVYTVIARLGQRAARHDLASAMESQRLKLWQHWNSKLPNNNFVRHQLDLVNHHT